MSELLPCPFCGSEADYWYDIKKVLCSNCEAEHSREAWNQRAERTTTATYDHRGLWTCGACGHFRLTDHADTMHYCPNCGARVLGE